MSKVIVQPLIEALSELVAQVSAIIVQNKAANKPPPQELPMCVMAIQKSAAQLVRNTFWGSEHIRDGRERERERKRKKKENEGEKKRKKLDLGWYLMHSFIS